MIKTKLNRTAKLAFYKARERKGDTSLLSEQTGFTTRFIDYVKTGSRKVNNELADAMYTLSHRRAKNSEMTSY